MAMICSHATAKLTSILSSRRHPDRQQVEMD